MTERALPPVTVGTRPGARPFSRPIGAREERPAVASQAARAGVRGEAILTTPARAGMLLGASAAVYAVSLAGVAALQSDADARLVEARAPYVAEVDRLRSSNDELERLLVQTDALARALASDYAATGAQVVDFQARLDALATLVAEVEGSAAALPARIQLPSVSARGAISGTSRPSTSATSGASGG